MKKEELKKLIDTAAGRIPADTVIKNCQVVNVFSGKIQKGDIALCGDKIAGIGEYQGVKEIDAQGRYAVPGFIDSHIHIESAYVSPEELGRLLVPHGAATIIADPHEIVNVCGIRGLDYMMEAAKGTALDIKYITRAGIHADGMLKNEEIYNIFDTDKFLNRPALVSVSNTSGAAGIAYWINAYYKLPQGSQVDKNSELVSRLKEWVDKEYEEGRVTVLTDDELIAKIDSICKELHIKL